MGVDWRQGRSVDALSLHGHIVTAAGSLEFTSTAAFAEQEYLGLYYFRVFMATLSLAQHKGEVL